MTVRPSLTIAQVVDQFDLSRATVRRGIESGKFVNASKDDQGRWRIPVESLVAAGVKPRQTWLNRSAETVAVERAHKPPQGAHVTTDPNVSVVANDLPHAHDEHAHELAQRASRIIQLEAELVSERRLREASERNVDDLRMALRMIDAAPAHSAVAESPKRRWWKRD